MADVEKFLRQASPENEGSLIGRRRLLWLAGGVASTFLLPGCGSGHSGSSPVPGAPLITPTPITPTPGPSSPIPTPSPTPVVIPDPIVFASADRLEPSGDLANQINQFSEAVDALSLSYSAPSEAITDFQNFINASQTRSRAASRATGIDSSIQMVQLNQYIVPALRAAYERTASNALMLDSVGYLGDKVTANNNLTGTTSVSNPQWVAAMMQRNYHLMNVLGNVTTFYKTLGIEQLANTVRMQTDANSILTAYAFVAISFNDWVDKVTAQVGVAAKQEWKLDLSDAVTADNVTAQLDRMPIIALSLPLGPGYFSSPTRGRSDLTASAGKFADDAEETILGKMAKNFLPENLFSTGTGSGLDKLKVATFAAAALEQVGGPGLLLKELLHGVGKEIGTNLIANAISTTFELTLPGAYGETIGCAFQIGFKAATLVEEAGLALGTSVTGVGLVVFGGLAVLQAKDLGETIGECAGKIGPHLNKVIQASAQPLDATSGDVSATRDVPAFTNPNTAECDQLSRANVAKQTIALPPSDTFPPVDLKTEDTPLWRKILCGVLTGSTTRATGDVPRTFANMQLAVAGLLLDHSKRNPTTVQASFNGASLTFFASDFAVLVRRNPGVTLVRLPAITNADLLCTGPGFLPTRSDAPKDLTNIASLPALRPIISGLGTGVTFGVK